MFPAPMIRREPLPAMVRAVVVPTAVTLALLGLLVGFILHFSTSQSDALALDRQNRLVRIAVEQTVNDIAVDQEASTYWDDAVLRMRETPLDQTWIDNNLGVWFHTYYKHDETYLLDASDRPVYAMQHGRRTRTDAFTKIATPALGLALNLRRALAVSHTAPEGSRGLVLENVRHPEQQMIWSRGGDGRWAMTINQRELGHFVRDGAGVVHTTGVREPDRYPTTTLVESADLVRGSRRVRLRGAFATRTIEITRDGDGLVLTDPSGELLRTPLRLRATR